MMFMLPLLSALSMVPPSDTPVPYGVGMWPPSLGNHRAVIRVKDQAKAVWVHLPWRLQTYDAAHHEVIVMNAATDQASKNIYRARLEPESADIVFEPIGKGADYYVYYLPYDASPVFGGRDNFYTPPTSKTDPSWLETTKAKEYAQLQAAELVRFEARGEFNRFDPMEIVATNPEVEKLQETFSKSYSVFPEDRRTPIRMHSHLPYKWATQGPAKQVVGEACRNEYFAYQLGVWASAVALKNVKVEFGDLVLGKHRIEAKAMNCINQRGVAPSREPITFTVNVPQGQVQALWCGILVPPNAEPGEYEGHVRVTCDGQPATNIPVRLTVDSKVLKDHGDSEAWRMSRLRWLDSTLGWDDEVVAPYSPLRLKGRQIECLGRTVTLGDDGLPTSIKAGKLEVLASPVRLEILTGGIRPNLGKANLTFTKKSKGGIEWISTRSNETMDWQCKGSMEFDGHLSYAIELTAKQDLNADDIKLEIPYRPESSTYMMGIGRQAGKTPKQYDWKWTGPYDSFWVGNVHAGLHLELRGGSYNGPLLNLYQPAPPTTWSNGGKGGVLLDSSNGCVASAYTGPRELKVGEKVRFEFALLVTPVKPLDSKKQFSTRYYHSCGEVVGVLPNEEALKAGVNVLNLHQATDYNPYINYPLVAVDLIRPVAEMFHQKGVKTKIYYTIRELTNYTPEFWALRSLSDEVFADGGGGGAPWLREHVVDHYSVAWVSSIKDGYMDAAVTTSGVSRWYNFYIEGLKWMCENVGIDGLYLDDVSYDRTVLKRMRKVMEKARPGCLIDLHSNTGFSIGPANQYAEFFPYVDRLWFGESFNYSAMSPEQFLVEVSGLPFGLGGEMLQRGGNPWRGALYGMTNRFGWVTDGIFCDPRPVWKIWDTFGIVDSQMIGYWEPSCPVRVSDPFVLATVYKKKGKTLIALASWAPSVVSVRLTVDWKALGLDGSKVRFTALESNGFQPGATFGPSDAIPVEPGKGWMLIVQ